MILTRSKSMQSRVTVLSRRTIRNVLQTGGSMRRIVLATSIGLCVSGCASSGIVPSLSGLGGPAEPEAAKPAVTAQGNGSQAAASNASGSGGIWANFSSAFSSGEPPSSAKVSKAAFDENEALRLINDYRASKGMPALTLDARATAAADTLAADMAKHDRMSHYGPDGADVGKRLVAAGY